MEEYMAQPDLFKSTLPYRPWATDDYAYGVKVMGREAATRRRYVQANGPSLLTWLVFDVDDEHAGIAWERANVAPPSWQAVNPANGHAHVAYGLEVPVVRSDAGRLDPLRYAAAVETGYRRALDADRSYAGPLCKNPLHPHWKVQWLRRDLYDLTELAEWLPSLPKPERKRAEVSGLGRNVMLFDKLRQWSYKARRTFHGTAEQWTVHVLDRAELLNAEFVACPDGPLSFPEVKASARSVAKWTWKHISAAGFSAYQAASARRRKAKQADRSNQLLLTELGLS